MRYKAFTIVEVLVSVIILATVATLLFQISARSKNNYIFYKKKIVFENISEIGLNHKLTNTNLYEQLKTEYSIKDDDFRKSLKKIKIEKRIKPYSTINLTDDFSLNINQIRLNSDIGSSYYYSIGVK